MSRDLTCNETMSAVDEAERKDSRRFFQQPVAVPIARIAPVTPSVAPQQPPRQFIKTYVRGQGAAQIPALCVGGSQKVMHAHGTAAVSSTPQCTSVVPGRSKLFAIRPATAAHTFFKSCDFTQLTGSPMTAVYLQQQQQQQQNLHIASAQPTALSISSSRTRECEESRIVRTATANFTNSGNLDSRRYLTSGRSVVGVGDISVRNSVRVSPVCSAPTVVPSRNGCKLAAKDLLRTTKTVTRISDDKADGKPIMLPLPAVNIASSSTATSVNVLPSTCVSAAPGQHDGMPGASHPGPSARPTILRKNREPASNSALRRLIVAEAHPQPGPFREVVASPVAAVRDDAGLMSLKRTAGENRMLSAIPFLPPDARNTALLTRKTPTVLIGNVVPNAKNCSDQVPSAGTPENSPRKRLRKQSFECTNPEKMKLLISTDRVVGDSFIAMKDDFAWKTADLDDGMQSLEDNVVPEKIPRRRGRTRQDNGAVTISVPQHVPPSVPQHDYRTKMKKEKKTQPVVSRNNASAAEASTAAEVVSNSLLADNFFAEKQTPAHCRQTACVNAELVDQVNDSGGEHAEKKFDDATSLICYVFGLEMPVPDDPCPKNKDDVGEISRCELPSTVCFFGDEVSGDTVTSSNSSKPAAEIEHDKQAETRKETAESTVSANTALGNLPDAQSDSSVSEIECRQTEEQDRKIFAQTIRSSGLKDRWQRFDRMSSCEHILKRMNMKRCLLQKYFRTLRQQATVDAKLNSSVIATLEDYSLIAAKKQTEKFLENYPICSPSTSDDMFEKNVNSTPADLLNYLEEALEVCSRSSGGGKVRTSHQSAQRSTQTSSRSYRSVQMNGYACRRDPETEICQAVAEVLAEIIKEVEREEELRQARSGQQQLGRKRKKKEERWLDVRIEDRFGTLELPQFLPQASNNDDVAFYEDVSRNTLRRERRSDALDLDDAFFANLQKELRSKEKRTGRNKNLSRKLSSLSRVRAVHQKLSDMRKAECDNLDGAVKLILDHTNCTDFCSYFELINEHNEDCQPYDSEAVREEKWQKRLKSFTKAVPPPFIPSSNGYDPDKAVKIHPSMNYIMKLFKGKFYSRRRSRPGTKRIRKSQSRRGRGRQRVVARPKKKPPTPEPKLEDLEPRFTAAEMNVLFKKEFGMDIRTFRYERCSRVKLDSIAQENLSRSEGQVEQSLESTEVVSVQNRSPADCDVLEEGIEMEEEDETVGGNEIEVSVSERREVNSVESVKYSESHEGRSRSGSSETVRYNTDPTTQLDEELSEHIKKRGRQVREQFATLLHALRDNEVLVVKAIRMFKGCAADLFGRENKGKSSA